MFKGSRREYFTLTLEIHISTMPLAVFSNMSPAMLITFIHVQHAPALIGEKMNTVRFIRNTVFAVTGAAVFSFSHAASVSVSAGQVFNLNGSYYSLTGTGALTYSAAKVSNDNLGGIVNSVLSPTIYNTTTRTATSPVDFVTLDNVTGAIQKSAGLGGGYQVATSNGLMTGGTLSVANMTYDAASKTLYADVHGVGKTAGDLGLIKQMAFFSVNSATGASAITGAGSFTSVLSGLYLTTTSMDYITKSLGLGSLAASVTKGTDFGSLSTTWTVAKATAPVPEPSTWALMGLGLVGLFAARRSAASRA